MLQVSVVMSEFGTASLSDGKIMSPVEVGWAKGVSWKRAGSFVARRAKVEEAKSSPGPAR
jgi:hypothetical protein